MNLRPHSFLLAGALIGLAFLWTPSAKAHCEIPCGIYGDRMRIDMIEEHTQTIEKSMRKIEELKKGGTKEANQLIRWTINKEDHANKLQEIVYQYFMNQRIKPVDADAGEEFTVYVKQITLLHKMLVASMKCKQTTDQKYVKDLRSLLKEFSKSYFDQAEHDPD